MFCLTRTALYASISLTSATQQDKISPPLLSPYGPTFDCANTTSGLFAIQSQYLVGLFSHCEAKEEEAHLKIIFSNILLPGSIGLVYTQHIKKPFCLMCPDYQTIQTVFCDCPVLPIIYHSAYLCAIKLSINFVPYLY